MTDLALYDAMIHAIAEAKAVDEVVAIHDRARALEAAARAARNHDAEADVAVIRLRAERRLGEMLAEQKATTGLNRGGRPKSGSTREPVSPPLPTLAEIGVDKKLSSRAQKLAAVPKKKFEGHIKEFRERVKEEGARVSARLVHEGEKAERRAANQASVEGGGRVEDLEALVAAGVTFATFYADPAWPYETWSDRGQDRSPSQHYKTETIEEIKAKPVAKLARRDAVLHLWVPSTLIPQALEVIQAWGFAYIKIGFIWGKLNEKSPGRHMGTGKWTRDEDEVCLFATRGSPERLDAGVRQHHDEAVGEHSAKPEEFRRRIERLTGGPYLELYGRRLVDGWTVWGNQVEWKPADDVVRQGVDALGPSATAGPAGESHGGVSPAGQPSVARGILDDFPDMPPMLRRDLH